MATNKNKNNSYYCYYINTSLLPPTLPLLVVVVVLLSSSCSVIGVGEGDTSADKAECANKLVPLVPCLAYAQGGAKTPTPDCCAGLKEVLVKSPKCICVLLMDADDPSFGVTINLTLAFALPDACSAPANVSDCPKLLNLAPNSKEAQIFQQYGNATQATNTTASSTGGKGSSSAQANATTTPESSGAMSNHVYVGFNRENNTGALLQLLMVAAVVVACSGFFLPPPSHPF